MTKSAVQQIPEYGWESNQAACAHDYLLPVVLKALQESVGLDSLSNTKLNILDAGCGNGYIAGQLLKKGHHVAGCDASIEGIAQASNTYPQARFEVASVYDDLSAKFGGTWDIVVSSEVIEHLYDPRKFIKNVKALMKSDGVLVLTTPYHGYFKNVVLAVTGKLDNHFTALWDGGHIKFWSYKTLSSLLTEFGFKDIKFYGAGRFPGLWKSMVVSAKVSKDDLSINL